MTEMEMTEWQMNRSIVDTLLTGDVSFDYLILQMDGWIEEEGTAKQT